MLKEHQALLAKLQECRKSALKLYEAGCNVATVLDGLRTSADACAQRIRDYEASARAAKPSPAK